MNPYIEKITPLVNDLVPLVKRPNLAYIEAMSSLTEAVIASADTAVDRTDLAFLYEIVFTSLTQLQSTLSSLKADDGFANTLQQLIDLHTQLLA